MNFIVREREKYLEEGRVRCSVSNCARPIFRGLYCGMHYKRKQRKQALEEPLLEKLSPRERALNAGDEWLNASSEDDKLAKLKEGAFLKAAGAWLITLGWRPPKRR